jgi:hypothetical protein
VGIHEFRDQLIVRETIYATQGWDASDWRARGANDSGARGTRQLPRIRGGSVLDQVEGAAGDERPAGAS